MKKIILFLMLASLQQLLAKDPTLEETFDFIYKKVALTWTYNDDGKIEHYTRISSFPDQRCTPHYDIKYFGRGDFPKWVHFSSYKLNMKTLDPSRVEVREFEGKAYVYFYCKEDKQCIQQISGKHHYKNRHVSDDIKINSKDRLKGMAMDVAGDKRRNAEQLKKALIHMIKLCGGTPELF